MLLFVLGPQGFLDTNMLVLATQNAYIWGLDQHFEVLDQ